MVIGVHQKGVIFLFVVEQANRSTKGAGRLTLENTALMSAVTAICPGSSQEKIGPNQLRMRMRYSSGNPHLLITV